MNSRKIPNLVSTFLALLLIAQTPLLPQSPKLVKVVSKRIVRTTQLPGEFFPFLNVQLHAKVPGYVEKVLVDRGSFVKHGQLLVQLSAPEMAARSARPRLR